MRLSCTICFLLAAFATNAYAAQVLLYNGSGSTTGDVAALETQLKTLGLSYATANDSQINAMTRAQFDQYKLILWPGGDSITTSTHLTTSATSNIHNAVVLDGVSYLGFCAGAFMAETSSLYNTFKLASTWFNFYDQGAVEMVGITLPGNASKEVVYWDGPELAGWGQTVARYSNGKPAVTQGFVGKNGGFVMISGVHPEANLYWDVPDYTQTEVTTDNAFARQLIESAFNKSALASF